MHPNWMVFRSLTLTLTDNTKKKRSLTLNKDNPKENVTKKENPKKKITLTMEKR